MKSIASQQFWSDHWQEDNFEIASENHPIRRWIESEIPTTKRASCFEIGCYPGKFLAVFGTRGYTLNGIDSFDGTDSVVSAWLKTKGYKVGSFYQADFWNFQPSKLYDVVCSFGFIEHFKNWREALQKHIELAKPGGLIMIDVPNLNSPLYYFLYKIFDPEVLKNHEFSAMNKDFIKNAFKKSKCKIVTEKYLGYFYFRFVTRHGKVFDTISKCLNFFKPLFELLPESIYKRYIVFSGTKNEF